MESGGANADEHTGFLDENGNIIAAKWKTFGQGAATYVVAGFDPDIAGEWSRIFRLDENWSLRSAT